MKGQSLFSRSNLEGLMSWKGALVQTDLDKAPEVGVLHCFF